MVDLGSNVTSFPGLSINGVSARLLDNTTLSRFLTQPCPTRTHGGTTMERKALEPVQYAIGDLMPVTTYFALLRERESTVDPELKVTPEEAAYLRQDLVLGLDVLSQLQGSWGRTSTQVLHMNLENSYSDPVQPTETLTSRVAGAFSSLQGVMTGKF